MLAQDRVQGPQLTAGMANSITHACLPHSLRSCRFLLRGQSPDVNLPGPEPDSTLSPGLRISQGSRELTAVKIGLAVAPNLCPDLSVGI